MDENGIAAALLPLVTSFYRVSAQIIPKLILSLIKNRIAVKISIAMLVIPFSVVYSSFIVERIVFKVPIIASHVHVHILLAEVFQSSYSI